MAAVLLICLVTVITALMWYYAQNRKRWSMMEKIPGPPTLPFLGNAHMIKPGGTGAEFYERVRYLTHRHTLYGMMRLWLGPQPVVTILRAPAVEVLLSSSKLITKSKEYDFLHPWLGTGLLTSTGSKWKSRRRLLTPTFHFKILQDFLEVFNEHSKVLVDTLAKKADGKSFDIFPYVTHATLDVICETAMGVSLNAQGNSDSDYVSAIYKISELVQTRQKRPWLWPDFLYDLIGEGKDFKRILKILHSFTEKVIRERKADFQDVLADGTGRSLDELVDSGEGLRSGRRLAFLDMLLYAANSDKQLTDLDIREEVDTFMFEGHDTTAASINWALHLIGAHPEVQKKLHAEMDDIFGESSRDVTMEDLKRMRYLECVIKEQLRLYPSVPMFARTLSEDTKIGAYDVPKGTTAIVVTSCLHRDPKYFPDPEKFDPERFTPENSAGRHPYAYVPFSAGPRNCIGQRFAMNEEKVLLSSVLRRYNIHSVQERSELHPTGELILRPQTGIVVTLQQRGG